MQEDLSNLKPQKSGDLADLKQFHNRQVKIEKADIIQVPSKFTPLKAGSSTEHVPQWVVKVSSEVLHTVGEGESKIEFRASEFFNLSQDKEGKLTGFPVNKDSNLTKFLADLQIKHPSEIVGKMATVKAYDKDIGEGRTATYLKFKY